jgi:hypothetical protein
MKLVDLNPQFLSSGGDGVFRADGSKAQRREGVGVLFDCPCGDRAEEHQCFIPFKNPIDGGPAIEIRGWERTGETFDTLTLSPSILRSKEKGGCGWHGWIRGGEVTSC